MLVISIAGSFSCTDLQYNYIMCNMLFMLLRSNVVDLRTFAQKGGALTAVINPAYQMIKHHGAGGGGGGRERQGHAYELVDVPQETNTPTTRATDESYSMMSSPFSRRRLPSLPQSVITGTGGDVGVVKKREETAAYDTIAVGK